jgi:hypothetical protein
MGHSTEPGERFGRCSEPSHVAHHYGCTRISADDMIERMTDATGNLTALLRAGEDAFEDLVQYEPRPGETRDRVRGRLEIDRVERLVKGLRDAVDTLTSARRETRG